VDDAVAGDNTAVFTVELRRIQRVRYRTDELAKRIRRGVRVAVERNDVFCAYKRFSVAGTDTEFRLFAAEHCSKREHCAPFALKAAEAMAAQVLCSRPGEKIKSAAVFFVQFVYRTCCALDKRSITVNYRTRSLGQVCQYAEHEVFAAAAVGEIKLLDAPGKLLPRLLVGQKRRDNAHGLGSVRHAVSKLQPRHPSWRHAKQNYIVQKIFRKLRYWQKQQHRRNDAVR